MNEIKIGSNRSFGIVFFVVFLLVSIHPLINGEDIRLWSLLISFIFLVLGLLNSKFLTPLNKFWFKIGIILAKIVSPLVMGFIFFAIVTPIGIIMRLFGKDMLNLKFNNEDTYWIEKKGPKSEMKNQF